MAKGENIYKRKDGRWEARYIKGYDAEQKIHYGYCYGRTYQEAKEKSFLAKAAWLIDPKFANFELQQQRFDSFCNRWLAAHKERWKVSTFVKYQSIIEKHIKPFLGTYRLIQLNSNLLSRFSYELSYTKKLSVKTTRDVLTLLHQLLAAAGMGTGSLADTIIYPKGNYQQLRILTAEEYQKFTSFLMQDTDIYKFSMLLALHTGLRIGEICGLKWKHLSVEAGVLYVRYTVQRIKNPNHSDSSPKTVLHLGSPKTPCSIREIPLTENMKQLCIAFQNDDPETFVLNGSRTKLPEPRTLQRRLTTYSNILMIPDLHFHTLRHTFATRCIEVGCDVKALSELLGHSSIAMTMNRYVHPSIDWTRQNIQKLEQADFGCAVS